MKNRNILESLRTHYTIRMIKKILGTYKAPIWFYIKIFKDDNSCKCFIDNEMVFASKVNVDLMKIISKKLKQKIEHKPVNWIDFSKIDTICDLLHSLGLTVHKEECNKELIVITVSGNLSERDIRYKLKTINNKHKS